MLFSPFIFASDFEPLYLSLRNVTFSFFFCIFFGYSHFFQLDICIDGNCYDSHHFYTISFTNYDLFLFDFFLFCCILVYTLGLRMLAAPGTLKGGSPVDIIINFDYCYKERELSHLLYVSCQTRPRFVAP